MIEKVIKYIPLYWALLIFTALFYQYIYYDFFGISIIEYLEITEIFTLFFHDLIVIGLLLILNFTLILFTTVSLIKKDRINKRKEDIGEPEEDISPKDMINKVITALIFSTTGLIGIYFFEIKEKAYNYGLLLSFLLPLSLFILKKSASLKDYGSQGLQESISKIYSISKFFVILILVLFLEIIVATVKYNKTINWNKKSVEVHLKDRIVKTSKNKIFVGKTNRYFFFYNTVEEQSTVVPVDDLKKVLIKK